MKMIYLRVMNDTRLFLLISGLNLLCNIGGNCLVVESPLGGDAVLPCGVEPNIDVTDLAVEWSRPDLPPDQYVHFQRNGRELIDAKSPSYKGRTSLFMDEFMKGNLSLKLTSVKPSDEGIYTGYIPGTDKKCSVRLIVVSTKAVPDVSEDKPAEYRNSYDSNNGSTEEVPTAGQFPWWGGLIITLIIIIIIIIGGLVYWKRQNILALGRRLPKHANPADDDRTKDGDSELIPMNGVSEDKPGLKVIDGTSTALM